MNKKFSIFIIYTLWNACVYAGCRASNFIVNKVFHLNTIGSSSGRAYNLYYVGFTRRAVTRVNTGISKNLFEVKLNKKTDYQSALHFAM